MVKEDVLKYLENNKGKLISGGELSKILNVSRTAIWKSINSLKEEGYNIESIANEGYKLDIECDMLSENIIKSNLKTKLLGNKFEIFKTIDSTSSYLKRQSQNKAEEGLIILSENQTNGRGRMSRSFFSPSNTSIYMSILLRPNMLITDINIITIVSAVSVLTAIENVVKIKPQIKWVNDILYNNRKLCGILTEAAIESESGYVDYIVTGIGVNINISETDFPEEIKHKAISIHQITNKYCDRNKLIAEIINNFEQNYFDLIYHNKKNEILDVYRKNLTMIGEKIRVIQGEQNYIAKAVGIDDNAELIIETEDGKIKIINSGEISIREL